VEAACGFLPSWPAFGCRCSALQALPGSYMAPQASRQRGRHQAGFALLPSCLPWSGGGGQRQQGGSAPAGCAFSRRPVPTCLHARRQLGGVKAARGDARQRLRDPDGDGATAGCRGGSEAWGLALPEPARRWVGMRLSQAGSARQAARCWSRRLQLPEAAAGDERAAPGGPPDVVVGAAGAGGAAHRAVGGVGAGARGEAAAARPKGSLLAGAVAAAGRAALAVPLVQALASGACGAGPIAGVGTPPLHRAARTTRRQPGPSAAPARAPRLAQWLAIPPPAGQDWPG
jgi:hypothetical protein